MKNIQLIIIIIIFVVGFYLFFTKKSGIKNTAELIIGTAAGYAPFVSINQEGQYEGFDIDIAHALAKQLGKKLVLKDLGSMTSLFTALEQGSIDAIIWAISITQDRLQKVAMVHYQGNVTDSYPLIFWKTVPEGITAIEDMKGKTVCVEPGSCQEAVLRKYSFIIPLYTEKVDDALLNIQYGKADAAFVESAIAKKFQNKYPEVQILNVPLLPQDQVQGSGIVLKKNNAALVQQISDAVSILKTSGLIAEFEKKWGINL